MLDALFYVMFCSKLQYTGKTTVDKDDHKSRVDKHTSALLRVSVMDESQRKIFRIVFLKINRFWLYRYTLTGIIDKFTTFAV